MSQNESTYNVGASNKCLCTYFYVDSTISSIFQAKHNAKTRKNKKQKHKTKNTAYRKACKAFSASSTCTNTFMEVC